MVEPKGRALTAPAAAALALLTLLASVGLAGWRGGSEAQVTVSEVAALRGAISDLKSQLVETNRTVGELNTRLARMEGAAAASRIAKE